MIQFNLNVNQTPLICSLPTLGIYKYKKAGHTLSHYFNHEIRKEIVYTVGWLKGDSK